MNDNLTPEKRLASAAALQKQLAFEAEVSATELGRRSFELRERALVHALAHWNADEHQEAIFVDEHPAGLSALLRPRWLRSAPWSSPASCM